MSAPFNALQHLCADADLDACLSEVRRCLAPDGRFLFDVFLPDAAWFSRSSERWYDGGTYAHPTHGGQYAYAERSAHDPATGVNTLWFRSVRVTGSGPERIEGQLVLRYLDASAIAAALERNGLRLVQVWGDFAGGPVRDDSESLIGLAQPA